MPLRSHAIRPVLLLGLLALLGGLTPPVAGLATPRAQAMPRPAAAIGPAITNAARTADPAHVATASAVASDPIPVDSQPVPHPEPPPPSLPARAPAVPAQAPNTSRLPLAFVPNAGQTDASVRFHARGMGGSLFFTPDQLAFVLPADRPQHPGPAARTHVVARLRFEGANPTPNITSTEQLPGRVNYFIGNDSTKWHRDLPTYAGIVYQQLYPGIDLHYDGTEGTLKSTYLVAPNADPTGIRWRYQGARDVRVDGAGNLVVTLPPPASSPAITPTTLVEQAPVAWQEIGGQRRPVTARYLVETNGSVHFALGAYDTTQPLTIDPTTTYSTFLGSGHMSNGVVYCLPMGYEKGFTP